MSGRDTRFTSLWYATVFPDFEASPTAAPQTQLVGPLPSVQFLLNDADNASGWSAHFGRTLPFGGENFPLPVSRSAVDAEQWVTDRVEALGELRQRLWRAREAQKTNHDKKRSEQTCAVGDLVWEQCQAQSKLAPKWSGPWRVAKVWDPNLVVIENPKPKTLNVDMLKPCLSVPRDSVKSR